MSTKFTLPGPEAITVSGRDADSLIASRDGDAALVYLYILRTRGVSSAGEVGAALNLNDAEARRCLGRLGELGLIRSSEEGAPSVPAIKDELPEYTAEDIRNELLRGAAFSSLVNEAQKSLGKVLSSDDLVRLFGIYDYLGLPPEVILQLITHCIHENARRYGPGRPPTLRYIEKAAYTWEREEIFTLALAEEHIKRLENRRSLISEISRAVGLRGREFTPTERKYVDGWIEKGFSPEAVEIAYDRTLLQTGKLAWGYMDSIISSWHAKGLKTPKDIQEKDSRPQKARPGTEGGPSGPGQGDIERMKRLLNKMNEG